MEAGAQTATIETRIPARLDRLPWGRFHWLVVIGLGTVWILDGLEVTIVGSIAARLAEKGSGIELGAGQIGTAAAFYVAGACCGALFFGQLTDRFGRKRLFLITLALYIAATVATAFAFAPWYFFAARFLTGAGIGGEYAAINSAIDELIPARVRGRVDLIINGSYWVGAAAGAIAAIFFLDTSLFATDLGWRLAFAAGAVLGLTILLIRRNVPESPRWLFIHGREEEAEAIVDSIESGLREETGQELPEPKRSVTVRQRKSINFGEIARTAFKSYPKRTTLGFSLFVGQAFLYNAITFDLGTILATYFGISSGSVPFYIGLFAIANFLGPLTLGRLFDTVGRKPMVSGTYLASAAVAIALGLMLASGGGKDVELSTWAFMGLVMGTFFLASAGASSAYLTVSEIFPMETRALAIAFFYAIGTAVGGITGPLLFGHLIATGNAETLAIGFYIGAAMMAVGGIAEVLFGVRAEQESLEDIATPLSATAVDGPEGGAARSADLRPQIQEARRHREEAVQERARAAEHRALAHEQRGAAIERGEEGAPEGEIEEALAQVAELHAQAQEELASACEETAESQDHEEPGARRAAEERAQAGRERARMLNERAEAIVAERGRDAAAHDAFARASAERARAAEQRALAAESTEEAGDEGRDLRLRERDERIRSRLERRERGRRGLRRFRPGPGPFYSPLPTLALGIDDPDELDHEVDAISRALSEGGEMSRDELARALGARFWGPGRFRAALRQAVLEGVARKSSRDRFAPIGGDAGKRAEPPVQADSVR
jgi:MFS family permease